jgi:predicted Holliday junction resolvase-like endonuclease
MEELLIIIGKLYVDIYQTQKYVESIQQQLKEKDNDILSLKQKLNQKDKIDSNDK